MAAPTWEALRLNLFSLFQPSDSEDKSSDYFCSCKSNSQVDDAVFRGELPDVSGKRDSHVDVAVVHEELPALFNSMAWHSIPKSVPEPASVKSLATFPTSPCNLTESGCDIPQKAATDAMERHLEFSLQPGDRFGMVLQEMTQSSPNGLLVVSHIDSESAFSWTVTGKRGVGVGDAIIKVNGQQAPAADLREAIVRSFSAGGTRQIKLVVRPRPTTFGVDLLRGAENQQRLGFTLRLCKSIPGCFKVKDVQADGAVQTWNSANWSKRICKGDVITHVNGVSQNIELMKKELAEGSAAGSALLKLRVLNPSTGVGFHEADEVFETLSEASTKASSTPREETIHCSRNSVGSVDFDKSSLPPPSVDAFAPAPGDARATAKGGANSAAKAKARPRNEPKHIYWDFRNQGSIEDLLLR
jgi:hypothetical protein